MLPFGLVGAGWTTFIASPVGGLLWVGVPFRALLALVGGVPHVGARGLILCRWVLVGNTPARYLVKLIPRRRIFRWGLHSRSGFRS